MARMDLNELDAATEAALDEVLGYLNYSSGTPDPRFQANLNDLFHRLESAPSPPEPAWRNLRRLLAERLSLLRGQSTAFAEVEQAEMVLGLTFDRLLPGYLEHHRDLLFHQSAEALFRPFFLARAIEALLSLRGTTDDDGLLVRATLNRLNDFIGHRPIATLRTEQKIEPYPHEWVRPVPWYLRGVGVAVGPYHDLIEQALAILSATDPALLDQACFSLEMLDELAVDPRAYDFAHPVNKRPNYFFGQWDPRHIDNRGYYRRFVLQHVTLDVLISRIDEAPSAPRGEVLWEAGAVLAGTMLMAALTSGRGPETHDSSVTLATLLPRIAQLRDVFYQRLIDSVPDPHGERLRQEAARLRQPLGGARQHLNQGLARLRALQQQHVHLARLYARMGYAEASLRQAKVVPVASARLACEIECRLDTGHRAMDAGQLSRAVALIPEIDDLLHRAIGCGAFVDPWNILGFQGQFSVFPALENSVLDPRVDDLLRIIEQIFAYCARLESEAAATNDHELVAEVSKRLQKLARWWDRYATTEVSAVRGISGDEAQQAASGVAAALAAWHEAGEAAGDIAFWRHHVEEFQSPKSYALVVDMLLDKRDYVASMALLMQWLSQAPGVPLSDGGFSFDERAQRWMREVTQLSNPQERWKHVSKFFDFLEANAEDFWLVPQFEASSPPSKPGDDAGGETESADEGLYSAAYDDVVYRDSTADGQEGSTLESGGNSADQLEYESQRLAGRLGMLATIAHLWKTACAAAAHDADSSEDSRTRQAMFAAWHEQASDNRRRLGQLAVAVHAHRVPLPLGTEGSLAEYDHREMLKRSILERVVSTYVDMTEVAWLAPAAAAGEGLETALEPWELHAVATLRALVHQDPEAAHDSLERLIAEIESKPLLYIPLHRGGLPAGLLAAQSLQQLLRTLLAGLPRLGLLADTCRLLATAQRMERSHPVGDGAVTEFDRLFQIAYGAIVESLIVAAQDSKSPASETETDDELIVCLQGMTESLLELWLAHSRVLRLSVLEQVSNEAQWQALVRFVERYGHDLFTPRFFNAGNLRGILNQGVDSYLRQLEELSDGPDRPRLVDELDQALPRVDAVRHLEIIIQGLLEHYSEYQDFNHTTTQSDQGELLYTLLDFLRLKVRYERVCWNLKPLVLAHQLLERHGASAASEQWRRTVAERTGSAADWHLKRLEGLNRRYGMQLPTVADRLRERFVRPLELDRIRALIRPAMDPADPAAAQRAFAALERDLNEFGQQPSGSGLDVPHWLAVLEIEVEQVRIARRKGQAGVDPIREMPRVRLSLAEADRQLRSWQPPAT